MSHGLYGLSTWEERGDGRRWELIPIAEPQTVNLWKMLTPPDQKMSFLVPVTNPFAFRQVWEHPKPLPNAGAQLIVNHQEWAARIWVALVRDNVFAREQGYWIHVRWMEPRAELHQAPEPALRRIP